MSDCIKTKIVQLMPADGWKVEMKEIAVTGGEGIRRFRLAAWALMECEDGSRYMDGIRANGLCGVVRNPNFVKFVHPDE